MKHKKITRKISRSKMAEVLENKFIKYAPGGNMKICIIQTGSWGDNINSTLMLPPIKKKYPDSTIDVYTSTLYGSAFTNNSYIDNIVEHHADAKNPALHLTITIGEKINECGYDLVLSPHPMFNHGNWTSIKNPQLGTNLICAWIRALEHNDIDYELPLHTVMSLTESEKANVNRYLERIDMNHRNILMEVHGESGQTFWSDEWTMKVAKYLLDGNTNLFISRKNNGSDISELHNAHPGKVHFVGGLSIRECAELFNRCNAFFSVSSGLSNACNTNWCKKDIQWIEVVNSPAVTSAPIRADGKVFWYDNDIESFLAMLRNRYI